MKFRNSIQSGTEFYCLWRKYPPDDVLESLYKWRIRESDPLKTVLEFVRHVDSSEDIDAQLSKVEDDREKEHRSETSITKFLRQKRENWDRSSGYESQESKWHWERKTSLLSVGKRKVSDRGETSAVSDTRVTIVRNRHRKPLQPLSHQHQEVEVRR